MKSGEPACFLELPLGRLAGMVRFTSFHCFSPFWTQAGLSDDSSIAFSHDQSTGRLTVDIPEGQSKRLVIRWPLSV